jgi:hypothetical protein
MHVSATGAIHYTSRSPPIIYNKGACWKSRPFGNSKGWAFTDDGSCVTNKENGSPESTGAGIYHPQSNKITTVNPEGKCINITINRAELARIAAALINEYTHIAAHSAGALRQIRSSILYPRRTGIPNS